MRHLSPAEFIDAADGKLPAARLAHLERCPRCGGQAAGVRSAIDVARASEAPEPSPLYWQQLSARVRKRVAGESIVPAWRLASWRELFAVDGLVPIASAIALVAAVFASSLMWRPAPVVRPSETRAVVGLGRVDLTVDPQDSEAWDMLTTAAAEMPIEDAHAAGMSVTAGAVDRAVQRLSPEEITALGELLQGELRRSGD
jgi:hypothetical protein